MSPKERSPEELDDEFRRRVQWAKIMWGGFYRCPTTNRILEALKYNDKVMCGCGHSNPAVPSECTERTGTHIVRFLKSATAEEYVREKEQHNNGV
jgi:hypothetical protein